MPVLRGYTAADWGAVLDLCLLAFAPACESLERLLGTGLDAKSSIRGHLRSLIRPGERRRLVVAELHGSVVGFAHYRIDRDAHSGIIGLSAVHPALQGRGIGSLMFNHVLAAMRAQGLKYATADTGGHSCHAATRRAYEKVGFVAVPMVHYFMKLGAPRAVSPPGSRRERGQGARHRTRRAG
jgi:GNAT superfamily N-acetyltransferase